MTNSRIFRTKIFILLIAMIFFVLKTNGQEYLNPNKNPDQYNYEHWTSDDGLPDNAIIKVIQSIDGYIWFCSYGGVTRFNGVEFFTYSSYNTPEIVNNSFTNIYEDNEGVIWAATSGNGAIAFKKGVVKAYTTEHGLPSNFVESFVQDMNGRFWVATSSGLCYKIGDKFTNKDLPERLIKQNIVDIDCDLKNQLWIATQDNGLIQYKGDTLLSHTKNSGLLSNRINMVRHEEDKIYVGTREGLNVISQGEITSFTTGNGLVDNVVISSELSRNGSLWIGSHQGFCRYYENRFQYFSDQHPVSKRDVTSILEDIEGNLWVSTYRGGLFKFWEGKFTNYSDYSIAHSNPYTVHAVIQQSKNDYVIIYEEGLSKVNTITNKYEEFSNNTKELGNKLKCGIIDSKGRFWIGTRNGLILHENDKIKSINKENGLINENVRNVMEDSKGKIWVGTFYGVTIINPKNNSMVNLTSNEGLSNNYIMHINEESEGKMWIGTKSGLNLIEKGQIKSFNTEDGLAGEFIFKTFVDSDGVLWVVGNAGLTRFKNGVFCAVTTKNGLISNTLFQIIEDDIGYFWFTTNQKGVCAFKVKKDELNAFCDGKITYVNSFEYDRSDGIKATAATSSSNSIKATDGRLWLATQQGVEVIDPTGITKNETIPPVKIEYFRVNDSLANLVNSIIIPYGKNRITIGFTSLSYRYSLENKYKYKLIGYDDEWNLSNGEMETSYTNLPDGKYTFKVIGSNNDDYWNNEGTSISFVILTPFYLTTWFFVLCVVIALGLALIIYNWRIASLKKAGLELERTVAERTHEIVHKKEEIETQKEEIDAQRVQIEKQHDELKEVNTHLENIVEIRTTELKQTYNELLEVNKELDTFIYRAAHDIRGPIARLQGLSHLVQILTKDVEILDLAEKLNHTAEDMNDVFYRLINIVRLKTSDLNYEEVFLNDMVNDVSQQFQSSLKNTTCEITINIDSNLRIISHKKTLETIMLQLIDNAYKFRKIDELARIEIDAKFNNNNEIVMNISDYGVGIDHNYIDKVFDMFYAANDSVNSAGLGLYTVKTATKVLKGDVKIVSNAADNNVTTFEVTIANMV